MNLLVIFVHQRELKEWRNRHGYTQENAANILYVTVGHYRKWEYGLAAIPRRVGAWVKILDMNPIKDICEEILDGTKKCIVP